MQNASQPLTSAVSLGSFFYVYPMTYYNNKKYICFPEKEKSKHMSTSHAVIKEKNLNVKYYKTGMKSYHEKQCDFKLQAEYVNLMKLMFLH